MGDILQFPNKSKGLVGLNGAPIKSVNINLNHALEQPDLYQCPFCGGKASLEYDERISMYYVTCKNCKVETDVSSNKDDVIKKWNRRDGI